MFNDHPELAQEYPQYKDAIHDLKASNAHFAKLFEEYHRVTRELSRVAQEIETPSDEVVEQMKKKRLTLKDELFAMIKKAA
jgi:uncharacterized protein YdcH (DUF465 family)